MSAPFHWLWLAGTLLPLGALWLLYRLALRGERCYGYNRALLLLAPVVAALWPLLPRPALPEWLSSATTAVGGTGMSVLLPAVQVGQAAGPAEAAWRSWTWLALLYLSGVGVGLGRLVWQVVRLRHLARRLPREVCPGYVLAHTGGLLPTSSFGRVVFWDDTVALAPTEAAAVLTHELAHVRQHHTLDRLWLEVWRVVLWPNPFAHLLLPALRLTHELLADREASASVGSAGLAATPYSTLLARLAVQRLSGPAYFFLLQPFTFSFTLTRIAMLQNQVPVRRWKQWLVLPMLSGLFLVACRTTTEDAVQPVVDKEARKATFIANVKEAIRQDSLHNGGKGWQDDTRACGQLSLLSCFKNSYFYLFKYMRRHEITDR
ncbi:MAG: M48 family metalloprotease, partial [Janthinobacterium lividum]